MVRAETPGAHSSSRTSEEASERAVWALCALGIIRRHAPPFPADGRSARAPRASPSLSDPAPELIIHRHSTGAMEGGALGSLRPGACELR